MRSQLNFLRVQKKLSQVFESLNGAILLYVLFSIRNACNLTVAYEKSKCFVNTMDPNYKVG